LNSKGVDHRLADKYVQSGWLKRMGHGAYLRAGSKVDWPGGVQTLQNQLGLDLHPGAMTAMELRGYAHYLAFGGRKVILFGKPRTKLPAWFAEYPWSRPVTLVTTNVFAESSRATSKVKFEGVEFAVATLERSAFEIMYLVPKRQSYEEALQVMALRDAYRTQVDLLIRCLPAIARTQEFALKGGTAINLFLLDMPRLSVDIDLTFLPINDRASALAEIRSRLTTIAEEIRRSIPRVQIQLTEGRKNTNYSCG
jgi:hypothetical protein